MSSPVRGCTGLVLVVLSTTGCEAIFSTNGASSEFDRTTDVATDSSIDARVDALGDVAPTCSTRMLDCDDVAANGCETDVQKSPLNCGVCGKSCGCGVCNAGTCTDETAPNVIASGFEGLNLAIDGKVLYYTAQSATGGEVRRFDLATGVETVLVPDIDHPFGLAYDDTTLFASANVPSGRIVSVEKGGGTPRKLALEQAEPTSILLLDDTLYWSNAAFSIGALMTMPKDGSKAATTLLPDFYTVLGLVGDASTIAWADPEHDRLGTCPIVGCTKPTYVDVSSSGKRPTYLVRSATTTWFTSAGAGIVRVKGGTQTRIAHVEFEGAYALAVDGARLYFSSQSNTGHIVAIDPEKTDDYWLGLDVVAEGQPTPMFLRFDDRCVYWANQGTYDTSMVLMPGTGSIARMKKR